MRMRMPMRLRVIVIVVVRMVVHGVAVIVIVHQLLWHVWKQLARCRRAAAAPFNASLFSCGCQHVVPREC